MARIATIVEFAGIPYAGKTSLLLALGIRLENLGRRVCEIREYRGADEFFERRKLSPDVNLARSLSFLGNLIEDPDTARSDVILCDRGVFDTQCWFNWFGEAQVPASYRALNRAAIDLLLEPRYRYVIVLVERSIEDVVRMHGARAGTIVNGPTLVALQRSYAEEVERFAGIARVVRIETDVRSLQANADALVDRLRLGPPRETQRPRAERKKKPSG